MNKLLLTFVALFAAFTVSSQCTTDIFFSEYVEGWNNNKALEIYNPTGATIDMSNYQIVRYKNGLTNPISLPLAGMLASNETYVIVIDKQDPTLTGQDTMVWSELQTKADTFMSGAYPGPMFFNGNDAMTIEKLDGTLVDIIGVKGQNPGKAWTCDATAGYTDLNGGRYMTKDKTLIRKATVQGGVTTWPTSFNPCAEWDSLPGNTFSNLGFHNSDCFPSSITVSEKNHTAHFFPNPVTSENLTIVASEVISSVEVYNVVGQKVLAIENSEAKGKMKVSTKNLQTGMYMVRVLFDDNTTLTRKVIIK